MQENQKVIGGNSTAAKKVLNTRDHTSNWIVINDRSMYVTHTGGP